MKFEILGSWMTTYLGKSCSFCLPRVPFVDCRQFMYLVISLLVLRAGYGIWLYQFLIIAYLFTWHTQSSPGDCKISFSIGRGFAEVYIVKKWKLPITLELDRVRMVGRVINLGRVKKGKYQEMHSWLVVWERRYRAVQFSVSWFTCSVFHFCSV